MDPLTDKNGGYRYLVDTTKPMMAAYPDAHVITDAVTGQIIALCPITPENKPICEGQFSFAPLVQRALERENGLAAPTDQPIHFTPWRVEEVFEKQDDGTTELTAVRILSADGSIVANEISEPEEARTIVELVNSRWPKLRMRVKARSVMTTTIWVWCDVAGGWWWSMAGMRKLGNGFYRKQKIAKEAARQWAKARRPGEIVEFVVEAR